MKKFTILGKSNLNWVEIDKDRAWECHENLSFHAYKDRVYTTHRKEITPAAARSLVQEYEEHQDWIKAEAEVRAAKEQEWLEWVASLPKTVCGATITPRGEVEDPFGNFLFTLPKSKVADIQKYIQAMLGEMHECD